MITNYKLFKENMDVRMMSFKIPERKEWVEMGENLGIEFLGRTYWIKDIDKKFMEENIGKSISFKYHKNNMLIEFPTLLKSPTSSK